jgi:hypothetical protein
VEYCPLPTSNLNCQFTTMMVVALDVLGTMPVELFHHTNIGRFLMLLLESGKCVTGHIHKLRTQLHWKSESAIHSTNRKQGKLDKQILIGSRMRGRY